MCLTKERPDFGPDQIKSSREIKPGTKVIPVYFYNQESSPVEIVGYFVTHLGKGFLYRNQYGDLRTMYFADKGLEPYKSGKWNKSNWLKRVPNPD